MQHIDDKVFTLISALDSKSRPPCYTVCLAGKRLYRDGRRYRAPCHDPGEHSPALLQDLAGWTCGAYRALDLPAEETSNPPEPNCHRRSPAKAAGTVNVKDLTLQQRELASLLNHRGMAEGSQAQFCLSRFFLSLCGLLSALLGPGLKLSASHVPTRRFLLNERDETNPQPPGS